ncbi:hypothetical protein B0A55_11762 [Friedmanniomyces simplex]|uniref:Uncharacterized protein n=1 Tax=Friedmanniomyces simplex TaxID=329884 RepID=A0A4U0WD85_9PEZI|nr:hypothetical protein B0A55_11762 [Friedmanniomyces simplex]
MADTGGKEQPETAPSTPSSQRDGSGSKTGKDKQCPFCGQPFTSSSLGRHLDLYIKPRNPKPPDGVHHVDEIKKLRGSITRRQPKMSLKPGANVNVSGWRQDSEESTAHTRSASRTASKLEMRITDGSPVTSPVHLKEGENMHTSFNVANWQATGVINDLPPRAPTRNNNGATPTGQAQRVEAMRRDAAGSRIERPEYERESMSKLQEDAEVGRAAELALREVLGSLEAAQRKVEPKELFPDIDFFSLAYPGLCLAILPAPPTLFSPTPFPGADTWSLTPPGQKQYDALSRHLNQAYKRGGGAERFPDAVVFKYSAHASGAYEHWQSLSESERAAVWNLEVCRAFARAQEQKERVQREHEEAKTRIRHLEAEYERLSQCQLPREYLMHPPNTLPASPAIIKELSSVQYTTAAADANYDADDLLNKWRTTVRATRRRQPPHHQAPPHTAYTATTYTERPPDRPLHADMVLNGSVFGVNGAMPRTTDPTRGHGPGVDYETPAHPGAIVSVEDGDEEEEEQADADADGEMEDAESGFTREHATRGGALVRQKRAAVVGGARQSPRVPMKPWALLNTNGKRPHAPTPLSGRAEGPKVYKERWAERGMERGEQVER